MCSAPAEPGPWLQALMLVNAVFLLSLAVFTLPLYSLCVQLSGEDYNPKYLPDDIVQNARLMQKVRPPGLELRVDTRDLGFRVCTACQPWAAPSH